MQTMHEPEHDALCERLHLYGISGQHYDAYVAIVRPKWVVSYDLYTLRRWVPRLGTAGYWLLATMQQKMLRHEYGYCEASRAELARSACISEPTVHRLLHGDRFEASGLCYFIQMPSPDSKKQRRWSNAVGRMVQEVNACRVAMDAPLAPVDQCGFAQYLIEHGAAPGVSAKVVMPAMETLANEQQGPGFGELLELFDDCATRFQPPANWRSDVFHPTVANVAMSLGLQIESDNDNSRFGDLCSRIQRRLVSPAYIGTHYFFDKLRSIIGTQLALVVLQLRSMCYWDNRAKNDTVQIGTDRLATLCCCTAKHIRSLYDDHIAQQFFTVEPGKGRRPPTFHVKLYEPIAPSDEVRYRALASNQLVTPTGQLGLVLDAPSERLENIDAPGERLEAIVDALGERLKSIDAPNERLSQLVDAPGEHLKDMSAPDERLGAVIDAPGEQDQSIKILNTHPPIIAYEQQQHSDPHVAVVAMLDLFGITGQKRKKALDRHPDPSIVRAWLLYTVAQPGLDKNPPGYAANRLANGDVPPKFFMRCARLDELQWRALWRASLGDKSQMTPDLENILDEWFDGFGKMFPRGPFGDEDPSSVRLALREQYKTEMVEHLSERHAMGKGQGGMLLEQDPITVADGRDTLPVQVWQTALGELQLQLTGATYDTWLGRSRLVSGDDSEFVIGVHNGYAKDWLENRLLSMVKRTLAGIVGHSVEVRFVVWNEESVDSPEGSLVQSSCA